MFRYFSGRYYLGMILGLVCLGLGSNAIAADPVKKTVEQVYMDKAKLKNKQVSVRGKVVKVNNGIMKRNFLHIQDGTGKKDTNDLIVTSKQTAKVGDDVTITGTVALDTDFGFGYKYPLLVEKSSITKH